MSSSSIFDPGSSLPGPLASRRTRMLIAAGVSGALTLIEPRDLGPWQRAAYRTAVSVGSGLLGADLAREDESIMDPARDGLLMGGLTMGLMDLTEHADGKIVDGLRGLGMNRPRLAMAVVNAASAALLYAMTPDENGWFAASDAFEESEPQDLPLPVRELVAMLLAAPEGGEELPGAATLRQQLTDARTQDLDYPSSDVLLIVEDAERLVVPHQQTWPATGSFERDGITYRLELQIGDGMLNMLSVMVDDETFTDEAGAVDDEQLEAAIESLSSPDFRWPRPAEVTVQTESEQAV